VAAAGLDAEIDRHVQSLLSSGPDALAASKRLVRAVSDMSLDEAGPYTADMIARCDEPEGRKG